MKLYKIDEMIYQREDTRGIVFLFEYDLTILIHILELKLQETNIPSHIRKGLFS
jgi:hypothetical protein